MKILTLDIETAPNEADVWGLWNQNISLSQLRKASHTLCFAWKWHNERKVYWTKDDIPETAASLLDEADVVVSYNGIAFDIPILQKDIAVAWLNPPSPFRQVDLYRVVKKNFKFPSHKLEHVAEALGVGKKGSSGGHATWVGVRQDDPKAWKLMEKYNRQDVVVTEALYSQLLPWINHPSVALYNSAGSCTNCGGTTLHPRGYTHTLQGKYQRFVCGNCGKWLRSNKRVSGSEYVGI